jgi:predicted DNA-binding transcriptional regulator AlpA
MNPAFPQLAELLDGLERLPADQIPQLLGDLETVKALLWARLISRLEEGKVRREEAVSDGNLLTAQQAAPLLGVKPKWLYRNAKKLPFAHRLSRKTLRFSESGLQKWRAQKRA